MKCYCDRFFYVSIFIAHILLYFSFHASNFWVIFSISLLALIAIAIFREPSMLGASLNRKLTLFGIVSGVSLYLLFALGKWIIVYFQIPLFNDLQMLYSRVSPNEWWQIIMLIFIAIPGEEIFWRGYVQKRLSYYVSGKKSIIYSAILYASAHIYSNSILLVISAIIAGTVWGYLYHKKKSLFLPIISHFVFNLLLLFFFPLV